MYEGADYYCDVAIPHPDRLRLVHDDGLVLAFHHTRPFWDVNVVVVPKRHIPSLTAARAEDEPDLRALLAVVRSTAAALEAEQGAATVLTYQESKHLHVHVASGRRLR